MIVLGVRITDDLARTVSDGVPQASNLPILPALTLHVGKS